MDERLETLMVLLETEGAGLHALLTKLTLRQDVAEDLLQELFLRLKDSMAFTQAGNGRAYAFRVAMNLAFDWRRKQKRQCQTELSSVDIACSDASPLSEAVRREELEEILDAAGLLSEQRREVFILHYVEQESYQSIAERLGKTPHQVRGLCSKAVLQIREHLSAGSAGSSGREVPDVRD